MAGKKFLVYLVIFFIALAFAFNIVVLESCNFFEGSTDASESNNVGLGIYRFKVNDASDTYNTNGKCSNYKDWPEGQDVPNGIRAAQVCAIIAPVCGLILLLILLSDQCCCKVPCSGILQQLMIFCLNCSMALVWLINRNDVCVSTVYCS